MTDDAKKIILRLHNLRPDVAQFAFFREIYPISTLLVRKAIIEFKKRKPKVEEIDFILYSPGGLADDAYRIIRNLRKNFKVVNIIVPYWAKSAATLLALGGTKIIMDEFGEFGPLDAQIVKPREDSPDFDRESALNDEHSLNEIETRFRTMYAQMFLQIYLNPDINIPKTELSEQLLKNLSSFFNPLLSQIDPYKLGEKKRILDIGNQYANRILLQFGKAKNRSKAAELVDYLVHECPDHGYDIDEDVVNKFVDNIFPSSTFGENYASILQELSLHLYEMSDDQIKHVGFVEPTGVDTNPDDVKAEENMSVTEGGQIVVDPTDENNDKS